MLSQLSTCEKEKNWVCGSSQFEVQHNCEIIFTLQKQKWGEQQQKQLNCFTKV
jgi:hypothetical protein